MTGLPTLIDRSIRHPESLEIVIAPFKGLSNDVRMITLVLPLKIFRKVKAIRSAVDRTENEHDLHVN